MRRLIALFLLVAVAIAAPGCKRKKKARATPPAEDGKLASVVQLADPRAAVQLIRGFHSVENDAWRWTQGQFAVALRAPDGAAQKGAVLELKFTLPQVITDKLKTVTLSATAGGVVLTPETYTQPGEYSYRREIPASAFKGEAITIEFALDKAFPPTAQDQRELGLVASSVGLQ